MVQKGDLVPHFHVKAVDGRPLDYSSIWQRRNLVLVTLPGESDAGSDYAAALADRAAEFDALEAAVVVTREPVPDVPAPGALVADRWGEIAYVTEADVQHLPAPDDLLAWLHYLQIRCAECEGEAK